MRTHRNIALGILVLLSNLIIVSVVNASDAETLINQRCAGCHTSDGQGGWSRISEQRKTPEAWSMTLFRMTHLRGAYLTDAEREQLVKYFADNQGLAPVETESYRYILEGRENTMEQFDSANFEQMCARCHSGARVALQRRSESEWHKLVHFHMGQFTSLEYQAMGRDRDWFGIALNQMVPYLSEQFPVENNDWSTWTKAAKTSPVGHWRVVGHQPGRGDYDGLLTVAATETDAFRLTFDGHYSDGERLNGEGQALVYTGFEWRASLTLGGVDYQQVMALSEDGHEAEGRMMVRDENEKGSDLRMVREDKSVSEVMAVYPRYLKAGTQSRLTIVGTNLTGELSLGNDIKIVRELTRSADRVVVEVSVAEDARDALQTIVIGKSQADLLAVYRQVNAVEVTPSYGVARLGGGQTPKMLGIFEAIGISAGTDGKLGTVDDVRLGAMPASWSVRPFDEVAAYDRDVEFAGVMDSKTGIFTPAEAGPNPKRRMSTNNVGNLAVHARVADGDSRIEGKGQLLVTVQRWNNAPIR